MVYLDPAVLPALVLVAVAGGLALMRSRPTTVQIGAELLALIVILIVLIDRGTSPLPAWQSLAARPDGPWLRGLAVVWWLVGARLIATLVALGRGRDAQSRKARLFSDLVAGVIYLSAAYVVAGTILDLPVQGLIATSGVIAVVLGLALQSTLSDLFSGIAVGIEQPFRVGDAVSIDEKLEGTVLDINLRSVQLRTGDGDIATIPNSVIAKASVVNHSRPSERRTAVVEVPVRSNAPAGRLIELLKQSLLLCPDVLETPAPMAAIKSLDRSGVTLAVAYHVATTARLPAAQGQLLRQAQRFLRLGNVLSGRSVETDARLREIGLFDGLPDAAFSAIEAELGRAHLEPGETLLARGDHLEALVIVAAGVLEVHVDEPDAPRRIGRIGPGEYLGEIGMTTGDPSPVTITALTAVDMLQLPKASLLALVDREPGLAAALERSVRRGAAMLERDAAARAVHPIADERTFLRRLRTLLKIPERQPSAPGNVSHEAP